MRNLKNILAIGLIFLVSFTVGWFDFGSDGIFRAIALLIGLMFLFNLVVRKEITFKPYFTSHWNIFSSKVRRQFVIDLPADLAFEKLVEIVDRGPYKLRYSDPQKLEILATTGFTWKSWGENVYLDIRESDGQSLVDLCSVAVIGIHTWGKNEDNCSQLVQRMEDSLTI